LLGKQTQLCHPWCTFITFIKFQKHIGRGKWGKEIQRGKENQRYRNLHNQKTGNQSIYKPYRLTSGLDDSIDMLGQKNFVFYFKKIDILSFAILI